jgi:RNA polymerase sigma factor (sigma-70 family)
MAVNQLAVMSPEGGLSRYLTEIRKFPMLSKDEEFMLAKRWKEHQDPEAAHKMVTSHLRLVAKIAMGYRGYGLPIGEVISEGNVGLMQAVKKFEPDKGFRLATYAMWWIRASIQEYILRTWSLVKMGTTANQKKLFFNLRRAKSEISALEEGDLRHEHVEQIATKLGVLNEEVISMNRRLARGFRKRMARLAGGRHHPQPRKRAGRNRGARHSHVAARRGHEGADRPRTPHPHRAPPEGRRHHFGRSRRPIRRQPRTRPPDRGPRLREAAKGDADGGGRTGAGWGVRGCEQV